MPSFLPKSSSFLFLLVLIFFASCEKKPVAKEEDTMETGGVEALDSSSAPPPSSEPVSSLISFDLKVKARTPEEDRRIKLRMRMDPDSLVWGSFAPAMGMEAFRVLLSDDSLHFIDRMNKRAYEGDPSYLNDRLGIPLDRESFQAILLGRPLFGWKDGFLLFDQGSDTLHYRPVLNDELLGLLSLEGLEDPFDSTGIPYPEEKRDSLERFIKEKEDPGPIPFYWVGQDSSQHLLRFTLADLGKERLLDLRYIERQDFEGRKIPKILKARVRSPEGISTFELEIRGPKSSDELEFPFNVPDPYERIRP